jgi:TonB family protein
MLAVIQSSILLSLTLCAVLLMRRQSAATRHAVLTVGLVSSLAVPFVTQLMPDVPRSRGLYARVQDQTEILVTWTTDISTPIRPLPAERSRGSILWIWLAGMVVGGCVMVANLARIIWLVVQSQSARDERWLSASEEIVRCLRLDRRVRLVESQYSLLGTWGIVRPKILLPPGSLTWPDERIRVVLTHELAHIKRFDWPVQMLAECARVVYWFNPLYWIACRWIRSESEHACDDAVLNAGFDAKKYATHLLDLARALNQSGRAWFPVLAMARPPHLERRFVAMLNPSLNHRGVSRVAVSVVIALALCTTLPLAALHAREVTLPPIIERLMPPPTPIAPVRAERPVAPRKAAAVKPVPPVAQGRNDGGLIGVVSDSTGAVIPGVRLTMGPSPVATGGEITVTTFSNETGKFAFPALTPGQYYLSAELPGFAAFRRTSIEIKASQTIAQNIFLSVGNIAQHVQVTAAGQPRPPAPQTTPQRIRVGGNVIAANLISQVKPVYPQSARDAGIEGLVHLQGIIGRDGTFLTVYVVSSKDRDLANAALDAVKQWRYKPTLLNGEPIEVVTDVEVEFTLAQ